MKAKTTMSPQVTRYFYANKQANREKGVIIVDIIGPR